MQRTSRFQNCAHNIRALRLRREQLANPMSTNIDNVLVRKFWSTSGIRAASFIYRFFLILTTLCFGAAGCSPMDEPPSKWLGRSSSEFFQVFGPPKHQEQMPGGG